MDGRQRAPPHATRPAVTITLNGQPRDLPGPFTVADLLRHLSLTPERVAVEINRALVPRARHAEALVHEGDVLEVVTIVGGGAPAAPPFQPLSIGTHTFRSRLLVGTGKYTSLELMRACLD